MRIIEWFQEADYFPGVTTTTTTTNTINPLGDDAPSYHKSRGFCLPGGRPRHPVDVEKCIDRAEAAGVVFSPYVKLWSRLHAVYPHLTHRPNAHTTVMFKEFLPKPGADVIEPSRVHFFDLLNYGHGAGSPPWAIQTPVEALRASDTELAQLPLPEVDRFLRHVVETAGKGEGSTSRWPLYAAVAATVGLVLLNEGASITELLTVPVLGCYPPTDLSTITAMPPPGVNTTLLGTAPSLVWCEVAGLSACYPDGLTYTVRLEPASIVVLALFLLIVMRIIFTYAVHVKRLTNRAARLAPFRVYLGHPRRRFFSVAAAFFALTIAYLVQKYLLTTMLNAHLLVQAGQKDAVPTIPGCSGSAPSGQAPPVRVKVHSNSSTSNWLAVLWATVLGMKALWAPVNEAWSSNKDLLDAISIRALIRCGGKDCGFHQVESGSIVRPQPWWLRTLKHSRDAVGASLRGLLPRKDKAGTEVPSSSDADFAPVTPTSADGGRDHGCCEAPSSTECSQNHLIHDRTQSRSTVDPSLFVRLENDTLLDAASEFYKCLEIVERYRQLPECLPWPCSRIRKRDKSRCNGGVCGTRLGGGWGHEKTLFANPEELGDDHLAILLGHMAWVEAYKHRAAQQARIPIEL